MTIEPITGIDAPATAAVRPINTRPPVDVGPPAVQGEALDLIWGASAIASALGRTRRAVFHLLESGELPAKKVGGRWVASRKALREHFEGIAA